MALQRRFVVPLPASGRHEGLGFGGDSGKGVKKRKDCLLRNKLPSSY